MNTSSASDELIEKGKHGRGRFGSCFLQAKSGLFGEIANDN
ncbi:hypothetical protein B4168_2612 [Anoxybacillus flavithermus]|nr:hypothetical protein B4168_2612 [Anoxybacillus flavithermus]OAO87377.1 hypothetical protein GT23_1026 [Parageobacillus thermoglucosidasius]